MDIRITRARRVFSDGKHNAFTGIAAAHGKVFIAFRSSTNHMIPDGAIKVIGSTDMETWPVAAEVQRPGVDLRDPKLVVWGEKLMVFCAECRPQKGCRSLVIQSSDGVPFGEPVPLVGIPDGRWLWHVRAHGDKLYGTAYTGWPYAVSLYSSHDGLTWELTSDFPVPGSEVYLDFDQEGILWALVRSGAPGGIPALCTAEPPYTRFRSVTCLPMRLEGPMIKRLDGGCVIVCRQSGPDGKRHCTRTDLFWLADGCDPRLVRTLPSGGDTSYAGWLDTGPGRAVLSYYSSHEHKMAVPHDEDDHLLKDPAHAEHSTPADIFLADVSYAGDLTMTALPAPPPPREPRQPAHARSTFLSVVETHPPVQGEEVSQEYAVTANGQAVPVYTAPLDPSNNPMAGQQWDTTYSFASFEFSGRVTVKISSSKPLTALSIRPASSEIRIKLKGKTATFTLKQPGNFVIERNNNGRKDPLLLFANPIETERPRQGDPGVIYYGPGRHNAAMIHLTSNQTLYIAGGAVVTGAVIARGDNIRILGRGLLENSGADYEGKNMILLEQCTRVRIEGITIRKGSSGWTIVPKDCDGVAIANVKICGSFGMGDDGIDPVNTRNMMIEDCFIRTWDDCLAFKGLGYENRNCENITVLRTSLWSDLCCAMLFGDECRAAFMRNITVKDCHVLYVSFDFAQPNPFDKKLLMLHSGEEMQMENLRFENIDIYGEGQDRNYIEITCEFNKYNQKKVPGFIKNIVLKDVKVTGKDGPYTIMIKGFDERYGIDGVTFDNCTINGKPITEKSPNVKIGGFTKNIRFIG